jgi:hypothetical protein
MRILMQLYIRYTNLAMHRLVNVHNSDTEFTHLTHVESTHPRPHDL